MADEETVKKFINEDSRSNEAMNFLASQLNKEQKDRMGEEDMKQEIERLNLLREDKESPKEEAEAPRRSPDEDASDPTTSEEEGKAKEDEAEEEVKEEKKKEEGPEEFKKTCEELVEEAKGDSQEHVMKTKIEELKEKQKAAEERRGQIVEAATEAAESAERKKIGEEEEEGDKEESESEEKEEDEEENPDEEEKKKPSEEEKKKPSEEEKKKPGEGEKKKPELKELSDPEKDSLWKICIHSIGGGKQKDLASQLLEAKYVTTREMLHRKKVARRSAGPRPRVQREYAKMDEDVQIADSRVSRVTMMKSEIKKMEKKMKEELEMKQGELQMLQKEAEDARTQRKDILKSKDAASRFDEVLENAELSLNEIQAEMPEFRRLFEDEDAETEQRRMLLASVFRRTRQRRESGSESAAPTPVDATPPTRPTPKAIPREHKERMLKKEQEAKEEATTEKMRILKEKLEKEKRARDIGHERPNEPEGDVSDAPRWVELLCQTAPDVLEAVEGCSVPELPAKTLEEARSAAQPCLLRMDSTSLEQAFGPASGRRMGAERLKKALGSEAGEACGSDTTCSDSEAETSCETESIGSSSAMLARNRETEETAIATVSTLPQLEIALARQLRRFGQALEATEVDCQELQCYFGIDAAEWCRKDLRKNSARLLESLSDFVVQIRGAWEDLEKHAQSKHGRLPSETPRKTPRKTSREASSRSSLQPSVQELQTIRPAVASVPQDVDQLREWQRLNQIREWHRLMSMSGRR
eukprot:s3494_g7.t2